MNSYAEMGKMELRAACKAAGVKGYGNMNNEGMRAALRTAERVSETYPVEPEPVVEPVVSTVKAGSLAVMLGLGAKAAQPKEGHGRVILDGKAGGDNVTKQPAKDRDTSHRKHYSGYHIDADRATSNGVTRPSKETICGRIWDMLDNNPTMTAAYVRAYGEEHNISNNTMLRQFYAWRKFNRAVAR